jgi:hypothetical protein
MHSCLFTKYMRSFSVLSMSSITECASVNINAIVVSNVFLEHTVFINIHELYHQSTQYILLYHILTTYFDLMCSSSGITYLYSHLDIGFYFPYTGQCLHVRKVLTYMYVLLSKFVLYKIKLIYLKYNCRLKQKYVIK